MDRTTIVELHGEIDMLSAPVVRAHMNHITKDTGCAVLVDLRPVTFFDCSGLKVLPEAHQRAVLLARGHLAVVCDDARILALMSTTGTRGLFQPARSLNEALAR
ncbi:STAS domain-containing protein [Streptomyces rimosus]|uniref:STAS domain-containing protein n=1 Tax=Streptomyces rimosus TaxID=1927 RepID=UPI0037D1C1E8